MSEAINKMLAGKSEAYKEAVHKKLETMGEYAWKAKGVIRSRQIVALVMVMVDDQMAKDANDDDSLKEVCDVCGSEDIGIYLYRKDQRISTPSSPYTDIKFKHWKNVTRHTGIDFYVRVNEDFIDMHCKKCHNRWIKKVTQVEEIV